MMNLKFQYRSANINEKAVKNLKNNKYDALKIANAHLVNATELSKSISIELIAEELRLTQQSLGIITGEFTSDDLLGEIFAAFCIGK